MKCTFLLSVGEKASYLLSVTITSYSGKAEVVPLISSTEIALYLVVVNYVAMSSVAMVTL